MRSPLTPPLTATRHCASAGARRNLQLRELQPAQVEVAVGRAAADLDGPGDAIGQRDDDVPARYTKQAERGEARAVANRQRAALAVEADGRRIVAAGVLDVGPVEGVAQIRACLDIDRGPAVAKIQS